MYLTLAVFFPLPSLPEQRNLTSPLRERIEWDTLFCTLKGRTNWWMVTENLSQLKGKGWLFSIWWAWEVGVVVFSMYSHLVCDS